MRMNEHRVFIEFQKRSCIRLGFGPSQNLVEIKAQNV
jgi:hypothetical protein